MHILLTNDDSHASPLFEMLVDYLKSIASLTVVVPEFEQSWKGKSITRYESLRTTDSMVAGYPATLVNGTPADCANLGINSICSQTPDLLISGINQGENSGVGFAFSSGTIGACLEANISGIPAIALSQALKWEILTAMKKGETIDDAEARKLKEQIKLGLDGLFSIIKGHENLLREAITYNINFPETVKKPLQFIATNVGWNFYGPLFSKEQDNQYRHDLKVITRENRDNIDSKVIRQGAISVSKLDIRTFGQLADSEINILNQIFKKI